MAEQAKDVYTWRVTYQDGTTTDEFDEIRPDGRGWAEREDKPVQTITLARDGQEVRSVLVPNDAEPIFFRRRSIILLNPTTGEGNRKTVHCIGWTRGLNEAAYMFVCDDGQTLLTENLQAI